MSAFESVRLSVWQWAFLALGGHVALLCGVAVHELGHGLTALFLGGDFKDIFVSSYGGQAGASAPGQRNAAVIAAGDLAEILAGVAAFLWLRRRLHSQDPAPEFGRGSILLWLFAAQAVLFSVTDVIFAPAIQAVFGFTSGDWPLLMGSRPGLRWALFGVGVIAVAPLAAVFVRAACRLLSQDRAAVGENPGSIATSSALSFAVLLLPSQILQAVIAVVLIPWLDQWVGIIFGRTLLILLFAVLGGVWIAGRARRTADATVQFSEYSRDALAASGPPTSSRPVGYWNASLAIVAVGVMLVFGPTEALRRGLAVSRPGPDDYIGVAQRIRLQLTLEGFASPSVLLCSRPLRDAGSLYRRRLTRALAPEGPSVLGAKELSIFIARWNLGGAEVGKVSEPEASDGDWCWRFDLERVASPAQIALWPVTWIPESHIQELRISGGCLGAPVPNVTIDTGEPAALVWSRPETMQTVQRFEVNRGCASPDRSHFSTERRDSYEKETYGSENTAAQAARSQPGAGGSALHQRLLGMTEAERSQVLYLVVRDADVECAEVIGSEYLLAESGVWHVHCDEARSYAVIVDDVGHASVHPIPYRDVAPRLWEELR